jgi:hypothetical protein
VGAKIRKPLQVRKGFFVFQYFFVETSIKIFSLLIKIKTSNKKS